MENVCSTIPHHNLLNIVYTTFPLLSIDSDTISIMWGLRDPTSPLSKICRLKAFLQSFRYEVTDAWDASVKGCRYFEE